MKIGIVTILKVNNYGAELQAYATQEALCRMGYDAEIIDYLFYKNSGHIADAESKPSYKLPLSVRFKEWAFPKVTALRTMLSGAPKGTRDARFDRFHTENTRMSRTYRSYGELKRAVPEYDVYLSGSDQVWNPFTYTSLDPYFLNFAPPTARRVAYASSFGVGEIPEYAKAFYCSRLNKYHAIGVREDAAVRLVKELSGKDAQQVLDPTFLLDSDAWSSLASKSEIDLPEGYILVYELIPCQYINQLAQHISKATGRKIVRIGRSAADVGQCDISVADAGPIEFLRLFQNAGVVITNSFHGTAFSINFNKDFYTVLPLKKKNNSRQRSVLKMFGLENRLLVEGDAIPPIDHLTIDYVPVKEILRSQRQRSIDFLKTAIDGN